MVSTAWIPLNVTLTTIIVPVFELCGNRRSNPLLSLLVETLATGVGTATAFNGDRQICLFSPH